jgi:hypothetical protein
MVVLRTVPAAGADPTRAAIAMATVRVLAASDSIRERAPKKGRRGSKKHLKSRLVASMKYWLKSSGRFPQLAAIQKALAVPEVVAVVPAGSGWANRLLAATLKAQVRSRPLNDQIRDRKLPSLA